MAIYYNALKDDMQYGDHPYCFTPTVHSAELYYNNQSSYLL